MFNIFTIVVCFGRADRVPDVSTAVLTAVVKEETLGLCSDQEFRCGDGSCISLSSWCDGRRDCSDSTDEASCSSGLDLQLRNKRQARGCTKAQWQCKDGSCISFDGKCDGAVNCPDGSDETHALCRNDRCQANWFRCTYGACVDGTAPCNGVQECADNSDELLPSCRKETPEIGGKFKCANGKFISSYMMCDGVADCADASDETLRACAAMTCPEYLFQCAYGACVDAGSDCNGVKNCYDGSDESDELCNRTIATPTTESPIVIPTVAPSPDGACVLPPFPKNGRYQVTGVADPVPGQAYASVVLNVTCNPTYDVVGKKERICFNGMWSGDIEDCVRFCRLDKHPSVEFRCRLQGAADGYRECELYEPEGMVVKPECNSPNYHYSGVLNYMRCLNTGTWDYVARCNPGLAKNGTNITILIKDKDQFEIHVGSFQYSDPYNQMSGNNLNNNYQPTQIPVDPKPVMNPNGPVAPDFQQATPVTPSSEDYDVDEGDWRILGPNSIGKPPNLNVLGVNYNSNTNGVSVNVQRQKPGGNFNTQVGYNGKDDRPVLNKDRIVFRD